MDNRIYVEKMREEDLQAVMDIEQVSFPDPWTKEGFRQSMEQPYSLMLTARLNDEIIGYCCLYHILDEGEIINVAIHPRYRGRGLGSQMLGQMLDMGKALGIVRFILDVRDSNISARKLYEKAGFKKIAIQKNFYETPTEDGWLMELTV